jgi:hypothetical protein
VHSDDDLNAWLRGLSGEGAADSETVALAQAIARSHKAARTLSVDLQSPEAENHVWQQMRFRLRREGLLGKQETEHTGRIRWQLWAPAAAVATIVAVLVVPNFWETEEPLQVSVLNREAPNYRSGAARNEIASKDPLVSAQQFAQKLAKKQLAPTLYFYGGTATLDFDLPADQTQAVAKDLQRDYSQINVQAGFNRLVFTRSR